MCHINAILQEGFFEYNTEILGQTYYKKEYLSILPKTKQKPSSLPSVFLKNLYKRLWFLLTRA